MKKILALVLVIALGIVLCGCESKEEKVEKELKGTWKAAVLDGSNYPAVLTFNDGTASKSITENDGAIINTVTGSYKFDKKQQILATYEDGTNYTFILYVIADAADASSIYVLKCIETGANYGK